MTLEDIMKNDVVTSSDEDTIKEAATNWQTIGSAALL